MVSEGRPRFSGDAAGMRVAVVAARFNEEIVSRLVEGAVDALVSGGADRDDVVVHWVPGAFELPIVLARIAQLGEVDALVAIGAVIRGGTPHFEFVARAATDGIAEVARRSGVAIGFGLLTTDDEEQARQRAGGDEGNKGAEAAMAAVETANLLRRLQTT